MSRATWILWTSLAAGSLAGGFARYALGGAVQRAFGPAFPYGTFTVNMLGCFLIGIFDALASERFAWGPGTRLLLMTGFCGAFTTFSTLILETSNLLEGGYPLRAFLNAFASLAVGMLLFRLGVLTGRL